MPAAGTQSGGSTTLKQAPKAKMVGGWWRRLIPGWRFARRVAQIGFLGLFLYLFRATEYSGEDVLAAPVNLFFRMDPLNAAAAMLAGKAFIFTFWPALVVVLLTLVLGRFFCGWICPLGTLLDYFHRVLNLVARRTNALLSRYVVGLRTARYWILIVTILASILALPMVGYVDPFALLLRGFAIVVDPAWFHTVNAAGSAIENSPAWAQGPLGSAQQYVLNHALPFRANVFQLAGLTAGILAAIFALELVARRFWCRYLCPLGGMLGLFGRWSILKRVPAKDCGKCQATAKCAPRCRMGAFDDQSRLIAESCNVCMDCVAECPQGVASFKFKWPKRRGAGAAAGVPVGMSRRGFMAASALGIALPVIARSSGASTPPAEKLPHSLLRPPGVADRRTDADFLNLCIRCGECLKVCTTNGLQPVGLESGWAGLFSPMLVPRQGYCEYACTLCGQVCPTGAIPLLSQEVKQKVIIGTAAFDRDRCLPWAKNEECLVCEEHCPLPDKAIKFDIVRVEIDGKPTQLQRPYVVQDKCIGCGFCENKCPLEGPAGVHVYRVKTAPEEKPGMSPTHPYHPPTSSRQESARGHEEEYHEPAKGDR